MIKTRLIRLLSHAKKYIVFHVLLQWIALISQIIAIFTIAHLLEMVWRHSVSRELVTGAVVTGCAVVVIRFVCERLEAKVSYLASVDVKRILREKIYEKLLRLGASYREQIATSEVVQVSAEGVEQLETYFGKYLPQLFYSLLAPATLFIVLAFVDVRSSVVLLICVPLIPVSIVVVQKIAKRLLNRYWGAYTELGDSFLENLQGLTTLKIYQADEMKSREMDREAAHFRKVTMKVLTMQLNSTSVMDIVAYGGAAVGMVVAAAGFLSGRVAFAGTVSIILLASEFFLPLRLLGSFFHIAMNGMAASDKIFRLLDLPEKEKGTAQLSGQTKELRLERVCFSYDEDREILRNVSISMPAGSFVSLVGESGCGKSTIAGLLMGRNKGYRGSIRIGGQELSDIDETQLMNYITLIGHDSYLFKGTVEENLRMAKPDASEEELEHVLKSVNLWSFLSTQEGLFTPLAERAVNLSGGQRQRLALARALLHDSRIYIFDEATSNIDAESEEMIMEVIHELAKTKSVILISHRLSNVVDSDRIYMLVRGEVAESGTHRELMDANGVYRSLFEQQQRLEAYGKEAVV